MDLPVDTSRNSTVVENDFKANSRPSGEKVIEGINPSPETENVEIGSLTLSADGDEAWATASDEKIRPIKAKRVIWSKKRRLALRRVPQADELQG